MRTSPPEFHTEIQTPTTLHITSISLEVPYFNTKRVLTVIKAITLPHLKSMTMQFTLDADIAITMFHEAFSSLLLRSSCPLETLTLPSAPMTKDQLKDIFLLTPHLTTLRMYGSLLDAGKPIHHHKADALCQVLTRKVDSKGTTLGVLPLLTHLHMVVDFSFNEKLVMAMLESRRLAVISEFANQIQTVSLQHVSITVLDSEGYEFACDDRLRSLREGGLEVVVRSMPR